MVYSNFSELASSATHDGFGRTGDKVKSSSGTTSEVVYTPAIVNEYFACRNDPVYFLRNHFRMHQPIKGDIAFDPYGYQEHLINAFHKRGSTFALTARQMGKTTCGAAFLLWKALFEPHQHILVVAPNLATSYEIMDRIRYGYESVPDFLRPSMIACSKGTIKFDNGSCIYATAANPIGVKGRTVSLIYIDEAAFIPDAVFEDLWAAAMPCLAYTGGSCIITTTPRNSGSPVHRLWATAMYGEGNGFHPLEMQWDQHPERDQDWAARTQGYLGEKVFKREYGCMFS